MYMCMEIYERYRDVIFPRVVFFGSVSSILLNGGFLSSWIYRKFAVKLGSIGCSPVSMTPSKSFKMLEL